MNDAVMAALRLPLFERLGRESIHRFGMGFTESSSYMASHLPANGKSGCLFNLCIRHFLCKEYQTAIDLLNRNLEALNDSKDLRLVCIFAQCKASLGLWEECYNSFNSCGLELSGHNGDVVLGGVEKWFSISDFNGGLWCHESARSEPIFVKESHDFTLNMLSAACFLKGKSSESLGYPQADTTAWYLASAKSDPWCCDAILAYLDRADVSSDDKVSLLFPLLKHPPAGFRYSLYSGLINKGYIMHANLAPTPMYARADIVILHDIENVPLPDGYNLHDFITTLRARFRTRGYLGNVCFTIVYSQGAFNVGLNLIEEMDDPLVDRVVVAPIGRQASDFAIQAQLQLLDAFSNSPKNIVLIAGDGGYFYHMKKLTESYHNTFLLHGSDKQTSKRLSKRGCVNTFCGCTNFLS